MANPTTNYSFAMPTNTDLVKDLPADFEIFGQAVDTQMKTNADAAIVKTIVDAKGDIIAATAADTVARLAVGANDTVLTADSSTATGLKWAAPAGAGASFSLLNAGGTSLSGTSTSITGISGQEQLLILVEGASTTGTNAKLQVQFNTDTGSNYANFGLNIDPQTSYNANLFSALGTLTQSDIKLGSQSTLSTSAVSGFVLIQGCNGSGLKVFTAGGGSNTNSGNAENGSKIAGGFYNSASTISSVQIKMEGNTFDAGTVYIYGSAV